MWRSRSLMGAHGGHQVITYEHSLSSFAAAPATRPAPLASAAEQPLDNAARGRIMGPVSGPSCATAMIARVTSARPGRPDQCILSSAGVHDDSRSGSGIVRGSGSGARRLPPGPGPGDALPPSPARASVAAALQPPPVGRRTGPRPSRARVRASQPAGRLTLAPNSDALSGVRGADSYPRGPQRQCLGLCLQPRRCSGGLSKQRQDAQALGRRDGPGASRVRGPH